MSASDDHPPRPQKGIFAKGISLFYRRFIKPLSLDEDLKRRELILNIIAVSSIAMLVILDGLVLYHSVREHVTRPDISFAAFSIIPVFFVLLYALSRKGKFVLSSYLLIGAFFLSNSYAAYMWGINLPTALLSYALVIVISGILIGTSFGFVMTFITALFIIPIWYLQMHRIIILHPKHLDADDGIVFSVFYLVIMIVSWLSNREIEQSLKRARKSESDLKKERDLLEITVEERTKALQRAQFEKIEQMHRFAEFGQLASGLFHDILNLLNAISLRTEGDPEEESSLTGAFDTTRQIERFMLAIRKQIDRKGAYEEFSLIEGIQQAIQLVSYKANKQNVRIVFHYDPAEVMTYSGVPFKFHQLIINLLLNAIESYDSVDKNAKNERKVVISIHKEQDEITILVVDQGCGIPEAIQRKIFDPFFTTKDSSKGLGIGLATTRKIVEEDFHGTIKLESENNNGCAFTITFPTINESDQQGFQPITSDEPEESEINLQ